MDKVKSSNANSKFKTYLIDKLLNEQKQGTITSNINSSATSPNKHTSSSSFTNNLTVDTELKAKSNLNNLTESKEDLHSETGTYTIEDLDDNNDESKKENYNHHSLSNNNLNNLRQSTTSTNIDLVSARAAIDETFGIIGNRSQFIETKINNIQPEMETNETNLKSKSDELHKLNRARARNQTYSLTKDLLLNQNNNENNDNKSTRDIAQNKPVNSSFSASSSSSVSSSITGPSSVDVDSVSSLKKTKTYDVMPSSFTQNENPNLNSIENFNEKPSQPASSLNTSRTIGTDLLMGDTDKLIEQLNKKNSKKNSKENSGKKSQQNNESQLNCSSSSDGDSSYNLNQSDHLPTSSTIRTSEKSGKNDLAFSTRLSQSWTIPNEETTTILNPNKIESKSKPEENDDDYLDYIKLNKFGNGGISFDFLINKETNEENQTNQSNNLKNTKPKPVLSSSISTPMSRKSSEFTNATSLNDSLNTQLTLTTKFDMASNKRAQMRNSITTNDECSPLNSAKSTNVSLGTKIKSHALANKETDNQLNSSFTDTSSVFSASSNNNSSTYVNRALYLRQQSAKAKLLQDKTKTQSVSSSMTTSVSSSLTPKKSIDLGKDSPKPKTNSILKKTPSSPATKSTTNLSSTNSSGGGKFVRNSVSRTSSRNTSPSGENNGIYKINNNDRSLMTTSLNLPNGSSLPNNNLAFLRRKNYDPLKAVEQERLKKTQNRQKESSKNNESNSFANESNSFEDDLSDFSYSSLTIPTQKLAENVSNKQTYENILQSTLQRLCIRLIQTSTGVLDKIGESSSKHAESNSIFNNAIPQTELERMQQLAKLVNSMQLVNEHLQIIDSTLFTPKPEESYIKELTRIRQEVDTLKQNAALNIPTSSPIKTTNGLHGINKIQS